MRFLGYSPYHKGFKCLDIATGRVYVSRDVVFDETNFPFASLHANAGARLRSEISLLPPNLFPSSTLGTEHRAAPLCNSPDSTDFSGENCEENSAGNNEGGGDIAGTDIGADSALTPTASPPGSAPILPNAQTSSSDHAPTAPASSPSAPPTASPAADRVRLSSRDASLPPVGRIGEH